MLMRQNVVVVWLQCLLVNVVRHIGSLVPDHVDICMPDKLADIITGADPGFRKGADLGERRASL